MKPPHYLELLKVIFSNELNFIDIGAYRGTFTENLIHFFTNAMGILIEPTEENYSHLLKKFSFNKNLTIINKALEIEPGEKDFFIAKDSAQNSLLEFVNTNIQFVKNRIVVDSLDSILEKMKFITTIDFIKIDTQGNDLNILKGGIKILKKYKPAILTEFIFVPLYKNQGCYSEQLMFMNNLDYKLTGIYDVHFHDSGCVAFADLLFLSSDKYEKVSKNVSPYSNFICSNSDLLLEENEKLNTICEERLQLINNLTQEAEKRLQIINSLSAELERLKEVRQ